MTSWQKAVKILAIIFAIFLSIGIIGGIVGTVASLSFIFGGNDLAGDMKSYSLSENINSLELDISAAELVIKNGESFKVQSNHKYLKVNEKDGRLVITETKRFFKTYSGDVVLEITIPDDQVFENADITTGAGKVTIESLKANELYLVLGAGEADIGQLVANKKAEISGGAGKLTVSDGELSNLELDMGVGELKLTSKLLGNCDFDNGVGKTALVLIGTVDDYRIEIDKGIGEATVDGEKMSDGSVVGSGENSIDINGGIGEIKVSFKSEE